MSRIAIYVIGGWRAGFARHRKHHQLAVALVSLEACGPQPKLDIMRSRRAWHRSRRGELPPDGARGASPRRRPACLRAIGVYVGGGGVARERQRSASRIIAWHAAGRHRKGGRAHLRARRMRHRGGIGRHRPLAVVTGGAPAAAWPHRYARLILRRLSARIISWASSSARRR